MLKKLWQKIKDVLSFPWRVRAMLIELQEENDEEIKGNE